MQPNISRVAKKELVVRDSLGKLILLAVGIDNYASESGFPKLTKCSNDALQLANTIEDVWQLFADKDRILKLTSQNTKTTPSRGEILRRLRQLVSMSEENDRIVFYYSGHGHRLGDDFFLVPEDAYDCDDPESLINFSKIKETLMNSLAKQKIIILDACLSGPALFGKKSLLHMPLSKKYLAEYIGNSKGIAVLSSSTSDMPSYTKSPDPSTSLFTYYLIKGLRGEPSALDNQLLTVNSLHEYLSVQVTRQAKTYHREQRPSIDIQANGVLVLGDFSQQLLPPDCLLLNEFPIRSIEFKDESDFSVKDVLTEIRRWSAYSEQYLVDKVNSNLHTYLEDDLGIKAASLINSFGLSANSVSVEERCVIFPNGYYEAIYQSIDLRNGILVEIVHLDQPWFDQPDRIPSLIRCLGISPTKFVCELKKNIKPESLVPGLSSKNWSVTSALPQKIRAEHKQYSIVIEPSRITFFGFSPTELLGDEAEPASISLATGIFKLLGG